MVFCQTSVQDDHRSIYLSISFISEVFKAHECPKVSCFNTTYLFESIQHHFPVISPVNRLSATVATTTPRLTSGIVSTITITPSPGSGGRYQVVLIQQVQGFMDNKNGINYQCFFRLNRNRKCLKVEQRLCLMAIVSLKSQEQFYS